MAKPKKNGSSKRKVQDKADTVEMREGELELKQIEIADDDFDMHLKALKGAVDKMKTAKNLYDGCCKAAKKVSPALLDAVKFAIKLEGLDAEDVKRELEIKGYALKRTGSSIQLTIHDTLLGDEKDLAYKRGREAGANGKSLSNPYPAGSDLAEAFATGWRNAVGGTLGLSEEETEEAVNGSSSGEREAATLQ